MKTLYTLVTLLLISCVGFAQNFGIVIHGGAGTITKKNMTPELEAEYRMKLKEALNAGYAILEKGGSSVDAVEAAIKILEDSPLFNAGKGSVFTSAGTVEMDASIMNGKDLSAGSVAVVRRIKNPITAARAVMEKSKHVMMTGIGAESFAKIKGIEMVDTSYFFVKQRYDQLQKIKAKEKSDTTGVIFTDQKFGTVGAVALDKQGNIAAGTSTGGMTNKKFGRIGDSPIIGAGTYASNKTCAISCTGHGEYFIRAAVAHDVSSRMEYGGISLSEAARIVVQEKLKAMGGEGGLIGIDAKGNFTMEFNSEGMYRGYMLKDKEPVILIYRSE